MTKVALEKITEKDFMSNVVDVAHLHRWKAAHFRPAMTTKGFRTPCQFDAKGWPDLVLVRERMVFAELKRGNEKPTPEQQQWLDDLREAGQEAYLWSASSDDDWEEIKDVLQRKGDALRVVEQTLQGREVQDEADG